MILVEVGEQRSARDGPYVASPAFAQQGSKSTASVVGSAGANEKYRAGGGLGIYSGAHEQRLQSLGLVEAALVGRLPAFGLLGDFLGSELESALDSFCLGQIQQGLQRVFQLRSPSAKSHDSLLQNTTF